MNFIDQRKQLDELHGDLNEKKAEGPEYSTDVALPKTFWDRPLGRTLRGKNRTGKAIYTTAVSIGSTFLPEPIGGWLKKGFEALLLTQTGVPMDALLDFNIYQLIIVALAMLIMWGLPSLFPSIKEKSAWKIISGRLDTVADSIVEATDEDSDSGKKITRAEWKQIVADALKGDNASSPQQ